MASGGKWIKKIENFNSGKFQIHASKVMLKIPQARLQQYVNQELPEDKLNLEKSEEPETKLPTSSGS